MKPAAATRDSRTEHGTARAVAAPESFGGRNADEVDQIELVVVAHDPDHARQCLDIFGPAGRIAAGRDNASGGILAGNPPDGLTRPLVRTRGDRAGVDDHEIGNVRGGRFGSTATKFLFEMERVRLVDAAPEGQDGEFHGMKAISFQLPASSCQLPAENREPRTESYDACVPSLAAAASTLSASFFL